MVIKYLVMARKFKIKKHKSSLILFWEGEDVLYKTDHPEYMNSNKREAALKRITEEMGNIGVEITHIQLKKIMQNLRDNIFGLKKAHR